MEIRLIPRVVPGRNEGPLHGDEVEGPQAAGLKPEQPQRYDSQRAQNMIYETIEGESGVKERQHKERRR